MKNSKKSSVAVTNANLSFDTGKIEFKDSEGNIVEEDSIKDKTLDFAKKAFMLTPFGMTYAAGKKLGEKSGIIDRAINENELNRVENISFEQVVELIAEGKDKFDELDMTFNASQANGIGMSSIAQAVSNKDISIQMGKKGDVNFHIKVTYKK